MKRFGEWLLKLLRFFTLLFASGLILLACWVSLGRELMPWVADFRSEVEALASRALGEPVRIGKLEGRWQGFAPILSAYQIDIGEGDKRLSLKQLEIHPDILGSLLALKPRLGLSQLSGLNLRIAQDEKQKWQVEGLSNASDKPVDMQALAPLIDALQAGQIVLQDSRIQIEAQGAKPLVLSYANLALSNSGEEQPELRARLHLESGEALLLSLSLNAGGVDGLPQQGTLYLKLPSYDWASFLPVHLLDGLIKENTGYFSQLTLGGELWLQLEKGQLQQGALKLNADNIELKAASGKGLKLEALALDGYLQRDNAGSLRLSLHKSAAQLDGIPWHAIRLDALQQDNAWHLQADQLELASLLTLLTQVKLPAIASDWLFGLKPQAVLRNVQLNYNPAAAPLARWQFSANFERAGIAAFRHIPAASNVTGSIAGSPEKGELRFSGENISLHVKDVFADTWHYREAAGTLSWQVDEEGFSLALPYAKAQSVTGEEAVADMLLRLFWDSARESYLDLRVGIIKADAKQTAQYLPKPIGAFSPRLANWLKTAIRSGTVEEGYFQYQGSVHAKAPDHARAISLYLKAKNGELAFWPGWPALQKTSAQVFIENEHVRIEQAKGQLLQSHFTDGHAEVLPAKEGKAPQVQVSAKVKQHMQDLLQLLQQAPMGTAQTFAGWSGSGLLDGQVILDIPLDGRTPAIQAQATSKAASLALTQPTALNISKIQGKFAYDSRKGLSSPNFRAEILGHSVQGKIQAEGKSGMPVSRLQASGEIASDVLQDWLALKHPLPIRGSLPYSLALFIGQNEHELRIDSNLKGLVADLPAPFGKSSEEERESYLRLVLPQSGQKLWFASFGGLARLALAQGQQGQTARGELLIGPGQGFPSLPRLPAPSGISVRGRLPQVDIAAWQPLFAPYIVGETVPLHDLLRSFDIRLNELQMAGGKLSNLKLQAVRKKDAWNIELDSREVKGQVLLSSIKGNPISIGLDYLNLPASGAAKSHDPLADFDPRKIPPLNVRIDRLLYDSEPLGALAFSVRPNAQGMQIQAIDFDIRQLKIGGSLAWESTAQGLRSRYKGRLQGTNLRQVLEAWHFAPNVSSERFYLDVDGSWPGSPLGFSLAYFSGGLSGHLKKGKFRQVEGNASALRIFGLLNFEAIDRRLRLDFSDLLGKGLSYDNFKGTLQAQNGLYHTEIPLSIKGPSSDLELNGVLDMRSEQVDATLQVMLPLTNNLPLAAVIAGAPAVGGALFVIDRLLGDQVSRLASVRYQVKGNLYDPKITPLKQNKTNLTNTADNSPRPLVGEGLGERATGESASP